MIKVARDPISAVSQSVWGTKGAFAGPKDQLSIDSIIGFPEDLFGFSLGRTECLVLFEIKRVGLSQGIMSSSNIYKS